MEIKEEKRLLRQKLKSRVQELSAAYCREADKRIAEQLAVLEVYKRADVLFCYVGSVGEIDTMPILLAALMKGKRVGVPLCAGTGRMEAREIRGKEDLVPGAYGILEPKKECPLMSQEQINLALVPCLSCTEEGVRLGYGGGYYDRYLPNVPGMKLALCRKRLLSGELPSESHDIRMDGILTETGLLQKNIILF